MGVLICSGRLELESSQINKKKMHNISAHGGKREGAGRPAGMPNKATIEQGARLAELAKSYSDIAFNTLVDVAINGTSDSARIAAANSILDRGYGKPKSDGVEVVELPAIVIQRAE